MDVNLFKWMLSLFTPSCRQANNAHQHHDTIITHDVRKKIKGLNNRREREKLSVGFN